MSWVRSLQLMNFRCYEQASLDNLTTRPVILYGGNGAGKTNILEAVSFLSPGRGLRNAKMSDIQRRRDHQKECSDTGWTISSRLETAYGDIQIGTGYDPAKDKKIIRINGVAVAGQNVLTEYTACIWLTPQMDRLFLEASSTRRRFMDRLIFAFDSGHSARISRYEHAMRQRSKVLQSVNADTIWLEGLEQTMAQTGVAIAATRLDFINRLQKACNTSPDQDYFPRARLRVSGTIESLLESSPAIEVENMFQYQLGQSRKQDSQSGGAVTGTHKSDLNVWYDATDMPADQCSTGEQKALLIGLILAHARLIAADRDVPPILLLDEVAAHLDDQRRRMLHEILCTLGGQVWLTGTEAHLFDDLQGRADFFSIEQAQVQSITF